MSEKTRSYTDYTVRAFNEDLGVQDVMDFIRNKAKRKDCMVCGHSPLTVMLTGPADQSAMVITTRDVVPAADGKYEFSPEANKRSLPVFALWCEHCGHVQLHTIRTLARWVGERRKAEEENPKDGGDNGEPR